MSKSVRDELLEEFTRGFAFDESHRQQLNHEQMITPANTFLGWALGKNIDPKWTAFLTGAAEGFLAEADLVGPDWNPPEPEEVTLIGNMGRFANGDTVGFEQRHEEDADSGDAIEDRSDWWKY